MSLTSENIRGRNLKRSDNFSSQPQTPTSNKVRSASSPPRLEKKRGAFIAVKLPFRKASKKECVSPYKPRQASVAAMPTSTASTSTTRISTLVPTPLPKLITRLEKYTDITLHLLKNIQNLVAEAQKPLSNINALTLTADGSLDKKSVLTLQKILLHPQQDFAKKLAAFCVQYGEPLVKSALNMRPSEFKKRLQGFHNSLLTTTIWIIYCSRVLSIGRTSRQLWITDLVRLFTELSKEITQKIPGNISCNVLKIREQVFEILAPIIFVQPTLTFVQEIRKQGAYPADEDYLFTNLKNTEEILVLTHNLEMSTEEAIIYQQMSVYLCDAMRSLIALSEQNFLTVLKNEENKNSSQTSGAKVLELTVYKQKAQTAYPDFFAGVLEMRLTKQCPKDLENPERLINALCEKLVKNLLSKNLNPQEMIVQLTQELGVLMKYIKKEFFLSLTMKANYFYTQMMMEVLRSALIAVGNGQVSAPLSSMCGRLIEKIDALQSMDEDKVLAQLHELEELKKAMILDKI